MNSSIRVSDVFQPSWKYTKSQIWILAGLYIGYIIISFTLGIFVSAANGSVGGGLLSALVSMVLEAMFYLGYFQNMFQTMDGEEPQFSAYLQSPQKIVNVIVATLVYGIVVLLGTVLLIIPGIYVAIRLQFFLMFILDENAGAIDAMRKSWRLTQGRFGFLFLLGLTQILITIIGLCLLGIGYFVAIPLIMMMECYTYRLLNSPLLKFPTLK